MNEFIEKLIERLEEKKKTIAKKENKFGRRKKAVGKIIGLDIAIRLVRELAEEYNGGWIPLEEKLPNCGSAILILLKNKSDGITMDDGTTCDISWLRTEDYFISSQGNYKYEDVTHWQPLPYQPKGE